VPPAVNMEKRQKLFALRDLNLFQAGAMVWMLGTISGYFIYRLGGGGLYRDGYNLPSMLPMGIDFGYVYGYGAALREGISSYSAAGSGYPPLITILLLPLTYFPPHTAYRIYVLVLILALFSMIYLCLREGGRAGGAAGFFQALAISSVLYFSYPFNFALERGNSDLLAGAFAVISLFAMTRGRFFLSVIALAAATQFKLYPAILIAVLFLRFGFRSLLWFILLNAAALLMLGWTPVLQFVAILKTMATAPSTWEGNHSIYSYVASLAAKGTIFSGSQALFRDGFYFCSLGLFAAAWLKYWLSSLKPISPAAAPRRLNGAEIGLVGMSFCLMTLIPSVSYDYKLVLQAMPFLLLTSREDTQLFALPAWSRLAAVLAGGLLSLSLIPRDILTLLKTPWLLLLFLLYFCLAFFGKAERGLTGQEKT